MRHSFPSSRYVVLSLFKSVVHTSQSFYNVAPILHTKKVVVLVNQPQELQLKINDITHPRKIGFISVESRGVFGSVFTDYGDEFIVHDTTGEPPLSHMIASISSV